MSGGLGVNRIVLNTATVQGIGDRYHAATSRGSEGPGHDLPDLTGRLRDRDMHLPEYDVRVAARHDKAPGADSDII